MYQVLFVVLFLLAVQGESMLLDHETWQKTKSGYLFDTEILVQNAYFVPDGFSWDILFCPSTQPEALSTITVSPGSIIIPDYLQQSTNSLNQTQFQYGTISWYGVHNVNPNNATLSEVLSLSNGINGEVLAMHTFHTDKGDSFINRNAEQIQIPEYLDIDSQYTIYCLWNTTDVLQRGFIISSLCINLNIVYPPLMVGSSSVPRVAPTARSSSSWSRPRTADTTRSIFNLTASTSACTERYSTSTRLNPTQSTSRSKLPVSNPPFYGTIHSVIIEDTGDRLFVPDHLDNISVKDTILFRSQEEYRIHTSTLKQPCLDTAGKLPDALLDYRFIVNSTRPAWFFACPANRSCHCNRTTLFALNPGSQLREYQDNAPDLTLVTVTSPQPIITDTSIVVITKSY